MVELPTGTVTLLFTDIEGSTARVREQAGTWASTLQLHREVCRTAWSEHGGHELGTEGDSFFVVFETATQAIDATITAQRALTAADWPDAKPVRVRMGVHTGSPQRHGDGYVGMDVHRAARVAGAAHGGQIVVSDATAHLVMSTLDDGVALLDLGEHQLKDIPARTRLFQVTGPGLGREFESLRTQGGAGSLPVPLTATVGRTGELAELKALLLDEDARMVTLTGPGGTGKTRLATALAGEVAASFADGVYFVPLASVAAPQEVWAAIAKVLDVPADGYVPPGFFNYVAERRVLLVLDNLEQIQDADHVLRDLLASARHVTVVATSRRPLHVEGEWEHAVPPLEEPGAVQLFVEHARRVRKGFALSSENADDVLALCVALDGLPLAIELAAARTKLLSPKAILARIDQILDLASTDRSRDSRQRTVRGAIAWSYDLLTPAHQIVLDHLGVFEGGASYDALEAVVPADAIVDDDLTDLLFDLVDASLVIVTDTDDGESRFSLLATVQRFAVDQLREKHGIEAAFTAHAQHFYDVFAPLVPNDYGSFSHAGLETFILEMDNFRALVERVPRGLRDSAFYDDQDVPPLHIVAALATLGLFYSKFAAVALWVRVGLGYSGSDRDDLGEAALQYCRGVSEGETGNWDECVEAATQAIALVEAAEEVGLRSFPLSVEPRRVLVGAYYVRARWFLEHGKVNEARPDLQAITRQVGPEHDLVSELVFDLSYMIALEDGDLELAKSILEASPRNLAWVDSMSDLDARRGQFASAQARLSASSGDAIDSGDVRLMLYWAETFSLAIGMGHPLICARTAGAVSVARVVEGLAESMTENAHSERFLTLIRAQVTTEEWEAAFSQGCGEGVVDMIREMAALPVPEFDHLVIS